LQPIREGQQPTIDLERSEIITFHQKASDLKLSTPKNQKASDLKLSTPPSDAAGSNPGKQRRQATRGVLKARASLRASNLKDTSFESFRREAKERRGLALEL
jgi:hypothetical protein